MPDWNKIATLLHLREKLAGHPRLATLTAHVDALLANAEAEATHEPLPEKTATKAEEDAAKAARETEKAQAAAEAKAAAEEKAAAKSSQTDQPSLLDRRL